MKRFSNTGNTTREREQLYENEDERRELVQRIISSETFSRAAQLREILMYVTQQSFVDSTPVREQDIAVNVLGRKQGFDGTLDNIVRVQVGHLRKKLELYFANEGQVEPLILVIPKGTYMPRFEPRSSEPSEVAAGAGSSIVEESKPTSKFRNWTWIALVAGAFILTTALSYHFGVVSRSADRAGAVKDPYPGNLFIRRIFGTDQLVSVVTADTNLVLLQNLLHTDLTVDEYASKERLDKILNRNVDPATQSLFYQMSLGRYTSYGDAKIAAHCAEIAQQYRTQITMRYSRFMNIRDFEQGNFVLIGSRRGNPWVSLFDPKLNFVFEDDPKTHIFHFRNRTPAKGESPVYLPVGDWTGSSVNYAHIALVPNLAKTGWVLLLDGATMEATEAAAEFLFGKQYAAMLTKLLENTPTSDNKPVEILLRVNAIEGTANNLTVVASRGL